MPTAAKLIAALGFAITALLAAYIYQAAQLDDRNGFVTIGGVSTLAAALFGWFFLGPNPGSGRFDSIGAGLRSGVIAVICMAFLFGLLSLGRGMLKGNFSDPIVAIKTLFQNSMEILWSFADPTIIGITVVGAAMTGRLAGWAYINWK